MAQVGNLFTSLTLESSSFIVGLKKSVEATEKSARSIEGNLNKVVGAAQAFAGAMALDSLAGVAKRALDYASSLGEVSQQLGVSTRDLQTYRYAASQVGLEQGEMDAALGKLTRTLGEARGGSKAQVAAFEELGLQTDVMTGRISTAGDAIPRIADALSRVQDPATRARIEVDLFGKSGQKLDTLLAGGRGQIDQLSSAANRLGVVLSDQVIQQADEAADNLSAVKQVLEANIAHTVSANAGAISDLATQLTNVASAIPSALQRLRQFRHEMTLGLVDQIDSDAWFIPQSMRGTDAYRKQAQAGLAAIKQERFRSGLADIGALTVPQFRRAPTFTPAPIARGGRSSTPRSRGGSGGRTAAPSDWMGSMTAGTREAIAGMGESWRDERAEHYGQRSSELGWSNDAWSDIVKQIDKEGDLRFEQAKEAAEEYGRRMTDQTRTVADLYENVMRGGTKAFLRDFKNIGLQIVTQMAARLTLGGGSFGGAFQSAVSSVLPGFATGGSFRVGGAPGIDRNLIAFRATRGEMVDIRRPGQGGGGGAISVHVSKSPLFEVHVEQIADGRVLNAAPTIAQAGARLAISQTQRPRL